MSKNEYDDPLGRRFARFLDLFFYTLEPWPREPEARAERAAHILTVLGILILLSLFLADDGSMPLWMAVFLWALLAIIGVFAGRYWLGKLRAWVHPESSAADAENRRTRSLDSPGDFWRLLLSTFGLPTTVYEEEDRQGPWLAIFAMLLVIGIGVVSVLLWDTLTNKQLSMAGGIAVVVTFLAWVDYIRWRRHRHGA